MGLVYVYGYNLSKFEAFKRVLIKQYGLQDVIEASWIKPRGNTKDKQPVAAESLERIPELLEHTRRDDENEIV